MTDIAKLQKKSQKRLKKATTELKKQRVELSQKAAKTARKGAEATQSAVNVADRALRKHGKDAHSRLVKSKGFKKAAEIVAVPVVAKAGSSVARVAGSKAGLAVGGGLLGVGLVVAIFIFIKKRKAAETEVKLVESEDVKPEAEAKPAAKAPVKRTAKPRTTAEPKPASKRVAGKSS